jgi:hypothetical protein
MQAGGLGLISSGLGSISGIVQGGQQNKLAQTNLKATQEQTKALQAQNELEKTRLAQLQAAASLPKTEEKKPNQLLWWGLGIVGTIVSGLMIYFLTRKSR